MNAFAAATKWASIRVKYTLWEKKYIKIFKKSMYIVACIKLNWNIESIRD